MPNAYYETLHNPIAMQEVLCKKIAKADTSDAKKATTQKEGGNQFLAIAFILGVNHKNLLKILKISVFSGPMPIQRPY